MELFSLSGTSTKCSSRLNDQLDCNSSHQATEHDNPDGLDPSTAYWVLVDTWSCCHAASHQHDTRGDKIHEGICCGCEQRQGPGRDCSIQLDDEQTKVDNERSIDSELDLRSILNSVKSS